jgi:hypothetical protein
MTSQGRVAKSAILLWALLFNRFAVDIEIAVKAKKYAALGKTPALRETFLNINLECSYAINASICRCRV